MILKHPTFKFVTTAVIAGVLCCSLFAQNDDSPMVLLDAPPPKANGDAKLVMNFRDATLQTILDYLADQAGLIVINSVKLEDRITVINKQPVTLDEAVDLLNTLLSAKGYTTVRRDRLLRVVPLNEAKMMSVPVRMGNDPAEVGNTDTIITQVIPLRHATAQDVAKNLEPLMQEDYAELTANKSSNSLIITNTEANIKRIVEITRALDQSISQVREVRVFHLQYANAQDTAKLIETIFKEPTTDSQKILESIRRRFERGRSASKDDEKPSTPGALVMTSFDDRSNSVVVSASPDMLESIAKVIKELDQDTSAKQGVMIFHARNTDANNLQRLFNSLFVNSPNARIRTQQTRRGNAPTAADLVGNVFAIADRQTNSLVVMAPEANFPRLREILEDLDKPVPQVLVRVLIAELTHTDGIDIGVDLSATWDVGDGELIKALTSFGAASTGGTFMVIAGDYTASIQALQTLDVLDVLSKPYILTRDNQRASIFVGQEAPFVTNTRITDDGNTINTIRYRDVGIQLTVTPQINDDGLVVLSVNQTLSALLDSEVQISEDLEAQLIAKRTADTRVAVKDGQTVVIGGLMQEQVTKDNSQVPLLGDIPGLGELFKRRQEKKSKTELLLFLTPEVIMNPVDLVGMSENVRKEVQVLNETVEPGALQRHLDTMEGRDRTVDEFPLDED